jgi:hypothetical protein
MPVFFPRWRIHRHRWPRHVLHPDVRLAGNQVVLASCRYALRPRDNAALFGSGWGTLRPSIPARQCASKNDRVAEGAEANNTFSRRRRLDFCKPGETRSLAGLWAERSGIRTHARSMASITCRNYIATDAKFTALAAQHCTLLHARREEVLKLFSSPRDKSHYAIVNDLCGGRIHWVFPGYFPGPTASAMMSQKVS